jgi:hypothetical protein
MKMAFLDNKPGAGAPQCQRCTRFVELARWATASNKDVEGRLPYRILRVIDADGKVAWASDQPADVASTATEFVYQPSET